MSWSRSYSGSANEVVAAFEADRAEIERLLPEYEKTDVRHAIDAAEKITDGVPAGAKVTLSASGHGWRATAPGPGDSLGAGSLSVSLNYTIPAPA